MSNTITTVEKYYDYHDSWTTITTVNNYCTIAQPHFKWLHLPWTSRQPAVIQHMTGLWMPLCVIGENGTNGCSLTVFSVGIAFFRRYVATLPPYRSASGIGYTNKKPTI